MGNVVEFKCVQKVTFGKTSELAKLGFRPKDMQAYQEAYFKCLEDVKSCKKVFDVIAENKDEITEEVIENMEPDVLWDALAVFFRKSNVLIVSRESMQQYSIQNQAPGNSI